MRIAKMISPFAARYAVALGAAGLSGGCSNSLPEGAQVPVNQTRRQEFRKGIRSSCTRRPRTRSKHATPSLAEEVPEPREEGMYPYLT